MLSLDHPEVKKRFEKEGLGWKSKKTGKVIRNEILEFYQSFGGGKLYGLTFLGHPLTDEFHPYPQVHTQKFERGLVVYDPDHKIDKSYSVGGADVYLLRLDSLEDKNLWQNNDWEGMGTSTGEIFVVKMLDEEWKNEQNR